MTKSNLLRIVVAAAVLLATLVAWASFGEDDDGTAPDRVLRDPAITASSGLARSHHHDGVLFTHNDHDGTPRLFAVGVDGRTQAVLTLTGADVVDWEDVSTGPDGTLWVGDIGDDSETRPSVTVYRIDEPERLRTGEVTPVAYRFTYPDGPHDAKALLVHPESGGVYIVTDSPGDAAIYRAPHVITATGSNRLVRVATAPPGVTAGSFAPDGGRFVLVTRTQAFLYAAFGGAATPLIIPSLPQVESAEVEAGGTRLLVGSEGADSAVHAVPLPVTESSPSALGAEGRTLTDDCTVSTRGIPAQGALVGGALGVNHDPGPWEDQLGARLGVRRTYFSATGIDKAVATAASDLEAGRIPWVSFKLPYSWEEMARGAGDAWATEVADRLAALDGPVWLALHHEPEKDGDIRAWTRMQERLAPLVRRRAQNVAYSVILTGWNQFFGEPQYRLEALWPKTRIDILGIDLYNRFGVAAGGRTIVEHANFRRDFFVPVHRFAAARGAAWAVAETGLTDAASADDPGWLRRTHRALVEEGGVAFSYFNSTANSEADWTLSTPAEMEAFGALARQAPTLDSLLRGGTDSAVTGRTTPGRCR